MARDQARAVLSDRQSLGASRRLLRQKAAALALGPAQPGGCRPCPGRAVGRPGGERRKTPALEPAEALPRLGFRALGGGESLPGGPRLQVGQPFQPLELRLPPRRPAHSTDRRARARTSSEKRIAAATWA